MKAWIEKGGYLNDRGRQWLMQLHPEDVRNIAVIRQCAFGDMMASRPFLIQLRRFFPNAHVTLSTISRYQYALPADLVDRVHTLETGELPLKEQWGQLKALGAQDVLFDLADTSRSRALTLVTPAAVKLGFSYRQIFNRVLYDIGILRSDFVYEAEVLLHFLKVMGHKPVYPLEFAMPRNLGAASSRRVTYFPFAATSDKSSTPAAWCRLVELAARKLPDYQHVLLEGVGEHESGRFLSETVAKHPNVAIQPRLPLPELIDFIAGSRVLVAGDTGVRNVALATHTPTVGIFFRTVPYRYWPRYESCHNAVFYRDGQVPGESDIVASLVDLLGQLDGIDAGKAI
jgi:ADP-heptose:LPS heptosyltransferase